MGKVLYLSTAAVFAALLMLASVMPAYAGQIELFQDVETGQIFTKPGKNRVLLNTEETEAISAAMPSLYQDPETGAVYAKPADDRIPLASSAKPGQSPAPDEAEDAAAENAADKILAKLPSWVKKIQLKGDLRLRYDFQDTEGKESRHRGRYRMRLFMDAPVNDWFKVSLMLASGGDDPKSANQTFGPSFQAPDLRLRHAYAEFTPADWLMIRGGQMENVLWRPSDGIWDKDIKPTGGGMGLVYKNETLAEPFMNAAVYIVQHEKSSPEDPFMYVLQPGVSLRLADKVSLKLAGSYYGYESVRGAVLEHAAGSNTTVGDALVYDYDSVVANGELKIKEPVPYIEQIKVFGEYAYNFDPDVLNDGYIAGLKLGSKKIKELGDWELMYSWRRMGRDAILDILPDSDAMSGRTNITGHEAALKLGIAKHVEFGLDYYRLRDITTNIDEDRYQADFIFSF